MNSSKLLVAKLLLATGLIYAPPLPQQTVIDQALLGRWIARIPMQEPELYNTNGKISQQQISKDIVYLLSFKRDGKAFLKVENNGKLLRFDYRLVKPQQVALYDLAARKRSPDYLLIIERNKLHFYCPPRIARQESIDLIYEAKFIKQN